jgi:hypothetical protein
VKDFLVASIDLIGFWVTNWRFDREHSVDPPHNCGECSGAETVV